MRKRVKAFLLMVCLLVTVTGLPIGLPVSAEEAVTTGFKSENFNVNTASRVSFISAFGADMRGNDGDNITKMNHTGRSAGNVVTALFDLQTIWEKNSGNGTNNTTGTERLPIPKYNKVVYTANPWNATYFSVLHSATREGTDTAPVFPETSYIETRQINAYRNMPDSPSARQAFSFDATYNRYVGFRFAYMINGGTYVGPSGGSSLDQNAWTAEFEVYYVTPNSVSITAEPSYKVLPNDVISLEGKVFDIDNDEILDSELTGLIWTTDAVGAEINASTGELTVNGNFTGMETFNVTATSAVPGCGELMDTKQITISSGDIERIVIINLPDFIMTNPSQKSQATFYPEAEALDFETQTFSTSFEWSLAELVSGVEIDENTGAITVYDTVAADSFTVECRSVISTEAAVARTTVLLNEKVDLVRNKGAWLIVGWHDDPNGTTSMAIDGDSETMWDSGRRTSSNNAMAFFNAGEGQILKANYFRLKLGNIDNSNTLRIAGSTTLQENNTNALPIGPPINSGPGFVTQATATNMTVLSPRATNNALHGETYWSGYSAGTSEGIYGDVRDNLLTSTEITSYFKGGIKEFQYLGILNNSVGATDDYGKFTVCDFEVYNTAPNYVSVVLPEAVNVSGVQQMVNMEAVLYNGVAAEDAATGGTWSASGAGLDINASSGELTIPQTSGDALGTVTYIYEDVGVLLTETTIYVCIKDGVATFSDNPAEYFGLEFPDSVSVYGKILWADSAVTAGDFTTTTIVSDNGTVTSVTVKNSAGVLISGDAAVDDGSTVEVVIEGVSIVYTIQLIPPIEIVLAEDGTTYSASVELKKHIEGATLFLAEYSDKVLVQVTISKKLPASSSVEAILTNVVPGARVKAILFESIETLNPLCNVASNF